MFNISSSSGFYAQYILIVNPVTPLLQWVIWKSLYGPGEMQTFKRSIHPKTRKQTHFMSLPMSQQKHILCNKYFYIYVYLDLWILTHFIFWDGESSSYHIWGLMNLERTRFFLLCGWKLFDHKHRYWRKAFYFQPKRYWIRVLLHINFRNWGTLQIWTGIWLENLWAWAKVWWLQLMLNLNLFFFVEMRWILA